MLVPRPPDPLALVPFPPDVRQALTHVVRRVRPRLDAAGIIRFIGQLEDAADIVAVIRASQKPSEAGGLLDTLIVKLQHFRLALQAVMAQGLLDAPKARLGYASDFEKRLLDDLEILDALQVEARPRRRRPKGGRPLGGTTTEGRLFAAEVASRLRSHGARPTRHRDGVLADLLRALWPHVIGADLPDDCRRLLKNSLAD